MLSSFSDMAGVRVRVNREGVYLDPAQGCILDSLPPQRRALFSTLIRLACRGRTAQFLLVGLGRMKGRRWQWTVQPARDDQQIIGAELSCVELPRSRTEGPHVLKQRPSPIVPKAVESVDLESLFDVGEEMPKHRE